MNGKQAFRSYAINTEPEPLDEDKLALEQEEMKSESEKVNAAYASLKGHPGWELIKKDFEVAIASYRSGSYMPEFIKTHTREEVGDKTIISNAIADELERKVLTVEGAAMALEDEKPKRRRN